MPGFFSKIIPAYDKGVFYIGARGYQYLGNNVQHWHVTKIDSLGRYQWGVSYPSNFRFGEVNHVEYMANGNLLLSGWEGGQPVAKEIDDSTGNLVRTIRFPNISVGNFLKVKVYQAPERHFIVQGQLSINSYYTGRFDSTGTKIWGGVSGYGKDFFNIMADGSFWCTGLVHGINRYRFLKYSSDSTLIHNIDISSPTNNNAISFNDVIFLGDGSAIFGGSAIPPANNQAALFGSAMYLCKIDNIGRPFVTGGGPQLVLSNKFSQDNNEPNLQVYPNPFTHTLRLSHKGTAQLLDIHGRQVLAKSVEAGEELQVHNLPRGMYLLRLQSVGGKEYTRKVIKQ
ncbi:MAG: T9SS C-terminal target domain-containing protein [Chitinophagia bacterium]|nr:T9SS C-terminal target domain-containing protein [Chitinophagia bacterium]